MLTSETKRRIDACRDVLVGKLPQPSNQVELITLALIYKFMDDLDEESVKLGGKRSFFTGVLAKYRWRNLLPQTVSADERVTLFSEGVEALGHAKKAAHLPGLFRDIFRNAFLKFRDGRILTMFLTEVNGFAYSHSEELGNAFEYLLQCTGAQGENGQFRTPRHIIDFIVACLDPQPGDKILDPACGTGGFLVSAYRHILAHSTSPGSTMPGDKLTHAQRQKVYGNLAGYDVDDQMVKLSKVNLFLHSFPDPAIHIYDTLSNDARWHEKADLILANPPFMTPKGGVTPHTKFRIAAKKAEVLFTDYIAEHLSADGRGGVIVPNGIVATTQNARNRFLHEFAPTDFQLIISDEAHRTISGNNRAIFEYFVGAKLGLTATPRDYLKGVKDADRQNDPREYERRLLLDTYRTFGSDDGKPTFRYTLLNAVQHDPPYLVSPVTFDARTDITTKMLSEEGYAVKVAADEDGQETELVFTKRAYVRKFFSDETNLSFIRCFLDHAKRDPLTGEVGKTIFFAVSRKHATKLVTLLNEEATLRWPEAYAAGSTFAVQVTSDITSAQQMTIDFANNNLNGKSKWRADEFRDYDTSRARVCVTVGMMTTGYDCEDLLNVVLARPIMSPTDFIQIKGRGTRLFTFKHHDGTSEHTAKKDDYAIFDFFANCEYFEEDFDYDQKLKLPKGEGPIEPPGGGGSSVYRDTFTNTSPDPIANVSQENIDSWGMRIDREMYRERFAHQAGEAVALDAILRDAFEAEDWPAVEERVRRLLFEKPEEFWNLPKLQEIYKTDRLPSLREILARVFGLMPNIPTRGQLADEAFERFITTQETNATHSRELRMVFIAFLLDPVSRQLLEEGKFPDLRARDAGLYGALSRLTPEERATLIRYLQAEVSLKDFEQAA